MQGQKLTNHVGVRVPLLTQKLENGIFGVLPHISSHVAKLQIIVKQNNLVLLRRQRNREIDGKRRLAEAVLCAEHRDHARLAGGCARIFEGQKAVAFIVEDALELGDKGKRLHVVGEDIVDARLNNSRRVVGIARFNQGDGNRAGTKQIYLLTHAQRHGRDICDHHHFRAGFINFIENLPFIADNAAHRELIVLHKQTLHL